MTTMRLLTCFMLLAAGAAPAVAQPAGPVPAEFFGTHYVAAWASPAPWPTAAGVFRMHDATHRWHDIHTSRGQWDPAALERIHAVLLYRDRHGTTPAIYVLGGGAGSGFPEWAHSDIRRAWREHVRFIAERYRGRIAYYEIWNEADCSCWFGGSMPLLVELTEIAAREIRGIDPRAKIIAPSFGEDGFAKMAEFYRLGGGRHVDIAAIHIPGSVPPEADTLRIRRARSIAGDLPLWVTEGHSRADGSAGDAALLARSYLVLWLHGVASYAWYSWEMNDYGPDWPGPWVYLTAKDGSVTPAGVAFGTLRRWLVGRAVTDLSIDADVWSVTLDDGAVIVWTPTGGTYPVAAGTLHTLDGRSRSWPGGRYTVTAEPVLFRR